MLSMQYVGPRDGGRESYKILANGYWVTLFSDHHNWVRIISEHKNKTLTAELLLELYNEKPPRAEPEPQTETKAEIDPTDYVNQSGVARWDNDTLFYNDTPFMHKAITQRVRSFARDNEPLEALLRFVEKLMQNPNQNSAMELYEFLADRDLPLADDGDFYAYKAVTNNYRDKRTGNFDNSIGCVVTMPRASVDDNTEVGCSSGLHCGGLDYVATFGYGDDRLIIVKVNPRDVVSVPKELSYSKCRTCRYEVVSDYLGDLNDTVYDHEEGPEATEELPAKTPLDLSYLDNSPRCCGDADDDEDSSDEDSWDSDEDDTEDYSIGLTVDHDDEQVIDIDLSELPQGLQDKLQAAIGEWNASR